LRAGRVSAVKARAEREGEAPEQSEGKTRSPRREAHSLGKGEVTGSIPVISSRSFKLMQFELLAALSKRCGSESVAATRKKAGHRFCFSIPVISSRSFKLMQFELLAALSKRCGSESVAATRKKAGHRFCFSIPVISSRSSFVTWDWRE